MGHNSELILMNTTSQLTSPIAITINEQKNNTEIVLINLTFSKHKPTDVQTRE